MNLEQITLTVWVVFAGICCAAFYAYYQRRILGDLVRAILAHGALSEDTAVTLDEIGYGDRLRRRFATYAFRDKTALRKSVRALYPENAPLRRHKDEFVLRSTTADSTATDMPPQRYYIPEQTRHAVEVRYDAKGTSAATVLVTIVAFFVAALIVISLLPWIRNTIYSHGKTESGDASFGTQTERQYDTDENKKVDENEIGEIDGIDRKDESEGAV